MTTMKTDPVKAEMDGHQLKCLMCGHESFHKRKTHFDTALLTGLNPQWTHNQGYCLVCDHCGFIHWFVQK